MLMEPVYLYLQGKQTGVHSKEEYDTLKKGSLVFIHNIIVKKPLVITELEKSRIDLEALKKQAEATNSEYDRLTGDYQTLQVRIFGFPKIHHVILGG